MARKLKRLLFTLTPNLLQAIDLARGQEERCSWMEKRLWRLGEIKKTGIQPEERNKDGGYARGKDE